MIEIDIKTRLAMYSEGCKSADDHAVSEMIELAIDRIKELEAQIEAVKKCPISFEGKIMVIGEDGLYPSNGTMQAADVLAALSQERG